jgi:hypothetical protein
MKRQDDDLSPIVECEEGKLGRSAAPNRSERIGASHAFFQPRKKTRRTKARCRLYHISLDCCMSRYTKKTGRASSTGFYLAVF